MHGLSKRYNSKANSEPDSLNDAPWFMLSIRSFTLRANKGIASEKWQCRYSKEKLFKAILIAVLWGLVTIYASAELGNTCRIAIHEGMIGHLSSARTTGACELLTVYTSHWWSVNSRSEAQITPPREDDRRKGRRYSSPEEDRVQGHSIDSKTLRSALGVMSTVPDVVL